MPSDGAVVAGGENRVAVTGDIGSHTVPGAACDHRSEPAALKALSPHSVPSRNRSPAELIARLRDFSSRSRGSGRPSRVGRTPLRQRSIASPCRRGAIVRPSAGGSRVRLGGNALSGLRDAISKRAGALPNCSKPKSTVAPFCDAAGFSPWSRKSALGGSYDHRWLPSGPSRPSQGSAATASRSPSDNGNRPFTVFRPAGNARRAPAPASLQARMGVLSPTANAPAANGMEPSSDQATSARLPLSMPARLGPFVDGRNVGTVEDEKATEAAARVGWAGAGCAAQA